jgi:predicted HTH domain antitoxin
MVFDDNEQTMFENSPLRVTDTSTSVYEHLNNRRRSSLINANKSVDYNDYNKPLNIAQANLVNTIIPVLKEESMEEFLKNRVQLEESKNVKLSEMVEELKMQLVESQRQIQDLQCKLMNK